MLCRILCKAFREINFLRRLPHHPPAGLSSPLINALWGLCNLIVGYILLQIGQVYSGGAWSIVAFFVGVAAISIIASINFGKKEKE